MKNGAKVLPMAVANELVALYGAGNWAQLVTAADRVTRRYPQHPLGWKAAGKALFHLGKLPEAIERLSRVVRLVPDKADGFNDLGSAFNAIGRADDAVASYRRAVELDPASPEANFNLARALYSLARFGAAAACAQRAVELNPGSPLTHNLLGHALNAADRAPDAVASYRRVVELIPDSSEAHCTLGGCLLSQRRFTEAAASYQRAIDLDPESHPAYNGLGNALRGLDRLPEAEAAYRQLLALQPDALEGLINIGAVLGNLGRWAEARAFYRLAVKLHPDSAVALNTLGRVLTGLTGEDAEAEACLRRVIDLNAADINTYHSLGNILMRQQRTDAALEMYRCGQKLQPLNTWSASTETAEFSAVFLDTPVAGSTPVDYLAGKARYDRHFFCVIPDAAADVAMLRGKADVVFNMICNADDGKDILPIALDLVERIGRPTINHPGLIMNTDRETIARRFAEIPCCTIPRTIRFDSAVLIEAVSNKAFPEFSLPVLIRVAGTHGGDDFAKADTWDDISSFTAANPAANYYLIEYINYRSDDGFFRKYRVIFVDGEIFPYHLAIHDDWKVHHFRTAMIDHAWMRSEEERFLQDIGNVFTAEHQNALRMMAKATGLDYGGIDCGLDRDGRIVVFEANASMLVHDEKTPDFAYKNQYIARIKTAFDGMVSRRRLGQHRQ